MGIKILCSACFTFISKVTRFVISDSGPQFDPQGLGIIVLGFLGVRGLIWEEKKKPDTRTHSSCGGPWKFSDAENRSKQLS